MDTLATIAARHEMQPYEAAAALDLTWPYDESAELPEPIAGEYDAILDAMRTDYPDTDPTPEMELPGMWESADFMGGSETTRP